MSRSNRDQRRRPHSGKKCPESAAGGCAWCGTGSYKRAAARTARQGKRRMIREARDD